MQNDFFERVGQILEQARANAKTAVNLAMVYAYYEIGKNIIEEEQNGQIRAEYGKHILSGLSKYLTKKYGKGFSVDNLKLMRKFYTIYSKDEIGETVFPQFENLPTTDTGQMNQELTMMLLYLSHFTEKDRFSNENDLYAWKGYNFDVLNKLDDEDYIRQGLRPSRTKSVYITEVGVKRAKELMEKYGIEDW